MLRRTLCSIICALAVTSCCGCGDDAMIDVDIDINMDKVHENVSAALEKEQELLSGDTTEFEKQVLEPLGIDVDRDAYMEEQRRFWHVLEDMLDVIDKHYGKQP